MVSNSTRTRTQVCCLFCLPTPTLYIYITHIYYIYNTYIFIYIIYITHIYLYIIYIYFSVYKVSIHVIWKIETFLEEDTRHKKHCNLYIGQWHFSPLQSKHLGTLHSSPTHHQLPHSIFLNLIDCLKSLPFQRWF